MMKLLVTTLSCVCCLALAAQQRTVPGAMNYLMGMRPNNIFYHDTVYRGSKQFAGLFFRTRDEQLMRLYRKHQANKIAGNLLGLSGTIATIVGLGQIGGDNKGNAWLLTGAGFGAVLTGGYLIFRGQQHLQSAVDIFNFRYGRRASLSAGVGERAAGLVLKF